jgi:hypothetical protein
MGPRLYVEAAAAVKVPASTENRIPVIRIVGEVKAKLSLSLTKYQAMKTYPVII